MSVLNQNDIAGDWVASASSIKNRNSSGLTNLICCGGSFCGPTEQSIAPAEFHKTARTANISAGKPF